MCGIVGYIANTKIDLSVNLKKIKHRGPDAQNCYYDFLNNKYVGLGHTRLSIIDLDSVANQPFKYNDRYVIVFNGEIYNYIELRKILKEKGYVFSTSSDTEVLIAAYDCYGENIFEHLDGMFAFCIYDKLENKIFCARDHLGIKPFYYYYDDNTKEFYFASELKALFEFKKIPKKISHNAVCEFLFNGWLYEPDTGFENIFKIMPGGYIEFDLNTYGMKTNIYFDVAIQERISELNKQNNIEHIIDESIKRQCRSDVPLAVFFSGGIDSTVIVSKIDKPVCLTAKYDETDIKESGIGNDFYYSNKIGKLLKLEIKDIELTNEELSVDAIRNIVKYSEELIADYTYQISEKISISARRLGYKVMLSGMGADEIFGGYPRYKVVKFKKIFLLIGILLKPFINIIKKKKSLAKKVDRFFSFISEKDFVYAYSSLIGSFSKYEIKKLIKEKSGIEKYHKKISVFLDKVKFKSAYKKAFYLDLYGFLSHNFMIADKSSMQASIEVRVPLVNKYLVVSNFNEVDKKLLDFRNKKKQLKAILKRILPNEIINRKKTGFNPPMDILIKNIGKDKMIKIVNDGSLDKYINTKYIYKLIEEHFSNKNNNTYKLWQILYLNFFIEANE